MAIRFGGEHMRAFELASMDRNPLHTSEEYARTTPYGQPVVYGSLAFLACLGQIELPRGKAAAAVRVEYKGAMFCGVDYTLQVKEENPDSLRLALLDGSVTVLRARLTLRDGARQLATLPETGSAPLETARRSAGGFEDGLHYSGSYAPPRAAYLELLDLLAIDRARFGDGLLVTALCVSYLTGMELPGESSAFTAWKAAIAEAPVELPGDFEIELDSYDSRFSRTESRFTLGRFVQGTLTAIARPGHALSSAPERAASQRFAGKTALVIGASRGLGAAIALQLASEGCTVVGAYARSSHDAAAVAQASGGCVRMEQGNAADPGWCASLRERMQQEFGRLDLLVLSAAPAILPLRVEAAHLGRMQDYLQKGFALVAAPLAGFLDLVAAVEGSVLLISSSAVEQPPAVWPHYVALKGAVEGLVRAAAADHAKLHFTIARPDRIETDLINTPMGRMDAEPTAVAARRLVDAVAAHDRPGTVRFVS